MRKTASQVRRERAEYYKAAACVVVGTALLAATFGYAYFHDARVARLKAAREIKMTTAGQDMAEVMQRLCGPLQGHMERSNGVYTCTVTKAPQ